MAVGSFSAGLSGLNANAKALSVVGNNLANLNTVGFKASTVTFEDLVYQSAGAPGENPSQIGLGVGIGQVSSVGNHVTVALEGNDLPSERHEIWFRDHVIARIPGSNHAAE